LSSQKRPERGREVFSLAQFDNLAQKTRLSRLVVQRVQVIVASLRLFLRSSTRPNRPFSPNRSAVSVTQLGSPKGRPRLTQHGPLRQSGRNSTWPAHSSASLAAQMSS